MTSAHVRTHSSRASAWVQTTVPWRRPYGPITNLLQHLAQCAMDYATPQQLIKPCNTSQSVSTAATETMHTAQGAVAGAFERRSSNRSSRCLRITPSLLISLPHAIAQYDPNNTLLCMIYNPDLIYSNRGALLLPCSSQRSDTAAADATARTCHSQTVTRLKCY
jgi:hypothetical protein